MEVFWLLFRGRCRSCVVGVFCVLVFGVWVGVVGRGVDIGSLMLGCGVGGGEGRVDIVF